jgi:hypothetical protein
MAGLISFLLLSSISAMIIAGPRVNRVVGEDYYLFRKLVRMSGKEFLDRLAVSLKLLGQHP